MLFTIDSHGGSFSCFMIAIKGTKIAFYTYHNFTSLLYEYEIPNYKGFIPLNYLIPRSMYYSINSEATPQMYQDYVNSHSSFNTNPVDLGRLGALNTQGLRHPHILDLVNEQHKDDIHNMWRHVLQHSSDIFL